LAAPHPLRGKLDRNEGVLMYSHVCEFYGFLTLFFSLERKKSNCSYSNKQIWRSKKREPTLFKGTYLKEEKARSEDKGEETYFKE